MCTLPWHWSSWKCGQDLGCLLSSLHSTPHSHFTGEMLAWWNPPCFPCSMRLWAGNPCRRRTTHKVEPTKSPPETLCPGLSDGGSVGSTARLSWVEMSPSLPVSLNEGAEAMTLSSLKRKIHTIWWGKALRRSRVMTLSRLSPADPIAKDDRWARGKHPDWCSMCFLRCRACRTQSWQVQ